MTSLQANCQRKTLYFWPCDLLQPMPTPIPPAPIVLGCTIENLPKPNMTLKIHSCSIADKIYTIPCNAQDQWEDFLKRVIWHTKAYNLCFSFNQIRILTRKNDAKHLSQISNNETKTLSQLGIVPETKLAVRFIALGG